MRTLVPVTFEPAGVTVQVEDGTRVLDAAKSANIVVAAPCGGRGICGACGVRVTAGSLRPPDEAELAGLRRAPEGVRLACRARVCAPVTIRPLVAGGASVKPPAPEVTSRETLVAGVDLGTTSIGAALLQPSTGRELSRASVPNPQQSYGADVLSRLSAAIAGDADELRELAEQGIVAALEAAGASAGVSISCVERVVIAGNTAMAALLEGADVTPLAVHPFLLPVTSGVVADTSRVSASIAAGATVSVLPAIAGFVGGDALAATLAAGMVDAESPVLLVDFGTNAEIVLAGAGPLVVASAAAGPAFEGGGISCGGPAAPGAVTRTHVSSEGNISLDVIGAVRPSWFSGSGLVSAVAELRRAGHIDAFGRLLDDGVLRARFTRLDDGVLAVDLGGDDDGRLMLTQLDVRALQLAKAAVRVGIQAVLAAGGVGSQGLREVLVAGAFGSAIEPGDLIALGVLPEGVAGKTRRVGNAALEGAATVALDPAVAAFVSEIALSARHVDLALESGFGRALLDATEFAPYTA